MKDFRIAVVYCAFVTLVMSLVVYSTKAKESERNRIEKANWKYLELTEE
jgi:hypothetical protein